jgi:hypothetical protein
LRDPKWRSAASGPDVRTRRINPSSVGDMPRGVVSEHDGRGAVRDVRIGDSTGAPGGRCRARRSGVKFGH